MSILSKLGAAGLIAGGAVATFFGGKLFDKKNDDIEETTETKEETTEETKEDAESTGEESSTEE